MLKGLTFNEYSLKEAFDSAKGIKLLFVLRHTLA